MARTSRRALQIATVLAGLFTSLVHAQTNLDNLPDLATATQPAAQASGDANDNGNGNNNGPSSVVAGPSQPAFHLTGLPTIAGAGIPDLAVPYTGGAAFMQKSSLPEGTFFIAVGGTLAFLGACVLLWRAMVAWSINRSVKRTAISSMGTHSEKAGHSSTMYGGWGGSRKSSAFIPVSKQGLYTHTDGNSVSMENLTASGKQVKPPTADRSSTLPQDLFFSPTAHARESTTPTQRASSYMPAGFYSSPSSQPAGGAMNTIIGGSLAPYAQQHKRQSTLGSQMSRSSEPDPVSRGSTTLRGVSRDGPLSSRDGGLRLPSRDGRGSHVYLNPSSSSLMVGQSSNGSDTTPSRAPSAYLEDLFENHGNGPRERF